MFVLFNEYFFYFFIYSFAGWWLENSFSKVKDGYFFKERFLWGPFKPMYGLAPIILLVLIKPETPIWMMAILFFLIPTIVEYISGSILDKLFHHKWWDYSEVSFQLHGHICLKYSLAWMLLSWIVLTYLHPLVMKSYGLITPVWQLIIPFIIVYFITDMLLTIRNRMRQQDLFATTE